MEERLTIDIGFQRRKSSEPFVQGESNCGGGLSEGIRRLACDAPPSLQGRRVPIAIGPKFALDEYRTGPKTRPKKA
ncbi:hypothetical protein [Dyella mobilis]|uniref:hypothetical protein n=1 Tax=Dyella mobilis TaxID=1849582 RepID=UPI001956432A|nr:hypothetical protein [Dyella mobilis]